MKNDLEDHLLSGYDNGNTDNVFDTGYNNAHVKRDYHDIEDKIDKKFAFYNTQFNHISELEGMDLTESKDITFSDIEAIQAFLQKKGGKEEY